MGCLAHDLPGSSLRLLRSQATLDSSQVGQRLYEDFLCKRVAKRPVSPIVLNRQAGEHLHLTAIRSKACNGKHGFLWQSFTSLPPPPPLNGGRGKKWQRLLRMESGQNPRDLATCSNQHQLQLVKSSSVRLQCASRAPSAASWSS